MVPRNRVPTKSLRSLQNGCNFMLQKRIAKEVPLEAQRSNLPDLSGVEHAKKQQQQQQQQQQQSRGREHRERRHATVYLHCLPTHCTSWTGNSLESIAIPSCSMFHHARAVMDSVLHYRSQPGRATRCREGQHSYWVGPGSEATASACVGWVYGHFATSYIPCYHYFFSEHASFRVSLMETKGRICWMCSSKITWLTRRSRPKIKSCRTKLGTS